MRTLNRFLAVTLVALSAVRVHAVAAPISPPALMLGSAWYPEQWSEAQWESDLTLMQRGGFNMVRIGEFAWSSLEPSEGHYALDWMERAINAAAKHGIVVVLGTPTDTPPAWLTTKYPETLRVGEDGKRLQHGSRRHFSIGSAKYRELCAKIVEQMAKRFGHHPNVIGWQIGNEYTEDSFDDESRARFHGWLEQKYHSLEALNQQWVTAYWSQTYDTWNQIPMTTGRANPGLLLDYKRFVTDTWRSFQRNQIDVLRRVIEPRQIITTNLGGLGWANRFNRQVIASDLDLIGWDEYVGSGHFDAMKLGATHDLVRGWKQKNFWVLETQPGFVDWATVSNSLDQGETRALVWNAVGHGADLVAFWQWRSALNGQEQYHGSLVGPDGQPVPLYQEGAQTGAEFAKAAATLAGTSPESQVALLHDYDSRWAIDFNRHSQRYEQLDVLQSYYRALKLQAQTVDIVVPTVALERYKLVVAPSLNVISAELAKHLTKYVQQGGHLVLGPRSGMKNEFNALNLERQPGPLVTTLGGRVEQFYALLDEVPVTGTWGSGRVSIWAERLSTGMPDTKVLMRYGSGNDWLTNEPAAISRTIGKGTITYIGALFDTTLLRAAIKSLAVNAGVEAPSFFVPEGVALDRRVGSGREVFVAVNLASGPQSFALPTPMTDVLNDSVISRVELKRYGVAVLSRAGK